MRRGGEARDLDADREQKKRRGGADGGSLPAARVCCADETRREVRRRRERARRGGQEDGKDLDILTEADASSPAGCGMASRRIRCDLRALVTGLLWAENEMG